MRAYLRAFLLFCSWLALSLAAMGAEPNSAKPEGKQEAPLAYITVAGAPGDGEKALAAALGKRLSVSGVKTASALDTTVYSVEGIPGRARRLDGLRARRHDTWRRVADEARAQGLARQEMGRRRRCRRPRRSSSCSPRRPRRRPLKFEGERTHLSAADERSSAIANQLTLARHL